MFGPRGWGVGTRLVGALVMAHSDDEGLILPPKLLLCSGDLFQFIKAMNRKMKLMQGQKN